MNNKALRYLFNLVKRMFRGEIEVSYFNQSTFPDTNTNTIITKIVIEFSEHSED